MKKFLSTILALLMLLPTVVACNNEDPPDTGNGTLSQEEELPVAVKDLGGKVFNILSTVSNYGVCTLVTETQDTVLDLAIFKRNMFLRDRLDATMLVENANSPYAVSDKVRALSQSGDLVYDLFYYDNNIATPLAVEGLFASADNLGNVNFSKEWWDKTAIDSITLNNKIYALMGSSNIHFFDSFMQVTYNKDIADQLGIPNLAEKALSGDWTWEQLHQYTKQAYIDNGPEGSNSVKDETDRFGLVSSYQLMGTVLLTAGEDIVEYDRNNYPSFSGFTARTIDIYDNMLNWFYKGNETFISTKDNVIFSDKNDTYHDLFIDGESLFYIEPMGSLQKLKNVEFEYTILPIPKYDSDDVYRTSVILYAYGMYMPIATTDFETVGIFIDNLNYQSSVDVVPTYVEQIVSLQRVRNQDSYNVIQEIIFKSEKIISLLQIYDWNSLYSDMVAYSQECKGIAALGVSKGRTMKAVIEKSIGPKLED